MRVSKHIHVTGVVQGVGFRPFVFGLAHRFGLHGWVCNTSAGVEIVVQGAADVVQAFVEALSAEAPVLARIEQVSVQDEAGAAFPDFTIRDSETVAGAVQPVSPDVALCADCERELFDPSDRRYLYPFINCTHCGPRFTIIKDLPYDRPATTMADFALCADCRREYEDPTNRRFHAQPVACPTCGPFVQLRVLKPHPAEFANIDMRLTAILRTRRLLREGHIVAIKGLGGFHLACDAANERAVAGLRARKGRAGKPFALMCADLETVSRLCLTDQAEQALLKGIEKPIVLLRRRNVPGLAPAVAPGMDRLGVMLPYTPLHHLLLNQSDPLLASEPTPAVLVMTSGNFSEEPIVTENLEALERLAPLAEAFLLHNRPIHVRSDDSVVRVDHQTGVTFLRRSRGYAPYPVRLPFTAPPLLAVGGELKNTFCLAREQYAFLSHHIGDMENAEVFDAFERGVEHLSRLFRVRPSAVAHDLHPDYFTTRYAEGLRDVPCIGVQHHHAHIAACMADNGLSDRRVIGLAFDGTGYGLDGRIWGGEVLLASYRDFERFAHLEYLPLPGGDAATRKPWRIAVGYAEALSLDLTGLAFLESVDAQAVQVVRHQVQKRVHAPETSSLGRLFDVVACLAGVRTEVTYEAQAAMELEVLSQAWLDDAHPYPFALEAGTLRVRDLLQGVIEDARRNKPAGEIGARFHRTLAAVAVEVSVQARERSGLNEVALSGGVWQNQVLLELTHAALTARGFVVFTHRQTPANDGGLALGQVVIAAARLQG